MHKRAMNHLRRMLLPVVAVASVGAAAAIGAPAALAYSNGLEISVDGPGLKWVQVCGYNQQPKWVCTAIKHTSYDPVSGKPAHLFTGWWFKSLNGIDSRSTDPRAYGWTHYPWTRSGRLRRPTRAMHAYVAPSGPGYYMYFDLER